MPIAPSTYRAHAACAADPSRASARTQRDAILRPEIARLAEAGIEPSVGSVGDSYDNALAETINGLYKAEVIHRCGPWRSFEAVLLIGLTNDWGLRQPGD